MATELKWAGGHIGCREQIPATDYRHNQTLNYKVSQRAGLFLLRTPFNTK
nr:MAG TPA: hypothetical protein [Bacteriophage sp.]